MQLERPLADILQQVGDGSFSEDRFEMPDKA